MAHPDEVIDGRVHDGASIAFVLSHLDALHEAIAEGVDVKGDFLWRL